jgi:hypothetical protein
MAFSHENVLLSPEFDPSNAFRPWTRLRQLSITIYPYTVTGLSAHQLEEAISKSQLDLASLELSTPYWKVDTIAGIIMRNPNLKRLALINCNLSEQDWTPVLPSLANLHSITFHSSEPCTFESPLRVTQACPLIQHLDLKGFHIFGKQFKSLAETATALTSLTLDFCQFTPSGLRLILEQCAGLESLQVRTLSGLGAVKGFFKEGPLACSKLQELIIHGIIWTQGENSEEIAKKSLETMWTTLKKFTRLRVLTLRHVLRTDSNGLGIHWFGAPSSLEWLCLTGHVSWTEQDLAWIAEQLPRLDVLEYDSKEMDTTLLSWLQKNRPDVRLIPAKS